MKSRPRSVEREVAKHLTEIFSKIGAAPVQRIPVLGRTGPDITINELNLVIDVKSRISVPVSYFFDRIVDYMGHIGAPLDKLEFLASETPITKYSNFRSKIVTEWLDHMDEWTKAEFQQGISAIVLHRPKMPIGKSMVIIKSQDRRRLIETWKSYNLDHPTI